MVKFDPNNIPSIQSYFKQNSIQQNEVILVNKKNNEISKINLAEGFEWLNRMIVYLKVEVFETDTNIKTLFQDEIKNKYKEVKTEEKEFQDLKAKNDAFRGPKLQSLIDKVKKLNILVAAEKDILGLEDAYNDKAKLLQKRIMDETFWGGWKALAPGVDELSSKKPYEKEEYFKNGFEFLQKHSEEIKQMISLQDNTPEAIAERDRNPFYLSLTTDLNKFLDDYQVFIKARFQAFDNSLSGTDSVSGIVSQISDFHASIQGNRVDLENIFGLVTLPSLNLSLLQLQECIDIRTGDDYKNTINTIEKHFADKVEELSAGRSEAQKAFLQYELASQKISLPFDVSIENMTHKIESYKSSVNTLRKEIESLMIQKEELIDKAELTLKKENLNSLSEEIMQHEATLDTLKKDREQALSKLPPAPQNSPKDTIGKINEIKRELGPLLKLPFLAENANLSKQLKSLDDINSSLISEERAVGDLKDINSSWLKLSENPMQPKEQDQYIADGCKALSKLASMSPEGRRLTKENIDAVKFFKDSHEMLLSRSQEIEKSIRNSLNETPPDTKAVIRSLKELDELKLAYAPLNKIFYNKNMGNLYQYNFVQSPECIAANIQNAKLQRKLGNLMNWVQNEQVKLQESQGGIDQVKTNELKSNVAELASQLRKIEENIRALSGGLESVKQNKTELERSLETTMEEFTYSPLPGKWRELKDSLVQSEKTYNSAIQSLEGFINRSGLKTSAETVTDIELREVLVAPLVQVYNEEKAAVPEGYKDVVISDLEQKIINLNKEIKGAIEARDKNNAEVRKNIELQADVLGKQIRSNAVKLQELKADIKKQEAIISTQSETLKQLEQTRMETQTQLSSQANELNSIQNVVDEHEADLNAIQDNLKGLLGL